MVESPHGPGVESRWEGGREGSNRKIVLCVVPW